ncbi:MAG: hypothetical protein GF418_00140 [Chitinivibrionales bacterium]|nr:hypothetical protein [Chitinivibrionales bacterium]MBD3394008.1 hypothetical protein [Chitinivibrionales bacterium]
MNELKKKMIAEARRQHRVIYPCASHQSLDDCFTVERNSVIFWFNTEDQSTHLVVEKLY